MKNAKNRLKRCLAWLIWLLLPVEIALLLAVVHREFFASLTINDYLFEVWDFVSLWAGRAVTVSGVVVPILVFLLKKRWPKERTWKQHVSSSFEKVSAFRSRAVFVFPMFGGLFIAGCALLYMLCAGKVQFQAPPSPILVTPDGSEIYLITEASKRVGKIVRTDVTTAKAFLGVIDVGGTPDRMLAGPRSHCVYVLDSQNAKVTVINPDHSIREVISYLGKGSSSMALTPDERKLYISNVEPSPHGTITVLDLKQKRKPHEIKGFNCPESLAIVPDGSRLYVATQCGGDHDPVFVVNTRTDKIICAIADFAVGSEVVVAGKPQRAYVSRGGFPYVTAQGQPTSEPSQISVIDTSKNKRLVTETITNSGSALTTTPDGKYLLYSTGTTIEILNTRTQAKRSLQSGAPASGIAIGGLNVQNGSVALYAWIPAARQIYFTGLGGLLP